MKVSPTAAGLFVQLLLFVSSACGNRCTLCDFFEGPAAGCLEFGYNDTQTSLVLSTLTSEAIKNSPTPLSFSIEAWVWVPIPALWKPQPIFARYPLGVSIEGNSQAEFVLQLQDNGNLNLFFGGGTANVNRLGLNLDCGFNVIPPKKWTHVSLTVSTPPGFVNPDQVVVYINGQPSCQWPAIPPAWDGYGRGDFNWLYNHSPHYGGQDELHHFGYNFYPSSEVFDGTRQVLNDEPFVISNYVNPSCEEEGFVDSLSGLVDELRVWAGVRTPEQILATYNTFIDPTSPGLVGLFHLNQESGPMVDSSQVAADASLSGVDGALPISVISTAPIVDTVIATNFLPAELTFYIYPVDPQDVFWAQVDVSALAATETIYYNKEMTIPITSNTLIPVVEGSSFPVSYFYTTSPVSYNTTVSYRAVSFKGPNTFNQTNSEWVTLPVSVRANGCDGHGGTIDRCGVCNGNGTCAPFGCDGQGDNLNQCGMCNVADNCSCILSNYRALPTPTLDKSILFYDLGHLDGTLTTTTIMLREVTDLVLNGSYTLNCTEFSFIMAKMSRLQTWATLYGGFLSSFAQLAE